MRKVTAAVASTVVGVGLLTGCGSGSAGRDGLLSLPVPASVRVDSRQIPGLGRVLTDSSGRTLYMFTPDAHSRVSCTGPCAGTWPPLTIRTNAKPTAGAGVVQSKLATLADPNSGERVVTYGGFPLYTYAGDVSAGQVNGQALFSDNGPWYVVDVAGQPVTSTVREAS